MNSTSSAGPCLRSPCPRAVVFALLLCGALVATATRVQAEEKTYTLFQGDNISVGQGADLRPVKDVNGHSWVVVVDGKEVLVSTALGPINLKVTPLLKLTDVSATLSGFKAERSYTMANDPAVRLTRSLSQTAQTNAGYQASVNQATALANQAITSAEMGASKTSGGPGAGLSTAANQAAVDTATKGVNAVAGSGGADLFTQGINDLSGDFDALSVSFEISSPVPLKVPYIVTMARFHDRAGPEGSYQNLVYAKALDPVGSKAVKVEFQQAGFPLGYTLLGYEVHVYDEGREVATNVAPKRQVLTSEQAFEYIRDKYVGAHKGQTLQATPVMGSLPDDLAAQVAAGKYANPFYVKVSKDGKADEAFSDPSCKERIDDAYLVSVVRAIRFKPALNAGTPTEGVAMLNLTQLRL